MWTKLQSKNLHILRLIVSSSVSQSQSLPQNSLATAALRGPAPGHWWLRFLPFDVSWRCNNRLQRPAHLRSWVNICLLQRRRRRFFFFYETEVLLFSLAELYFVTKVVRDILRVWRKRIYFKKKNRRFKNVLLKWRKTEEKVYIPAYFILYTACVYICICIC